MNRVVPALDCSSQWISDHWPLDIHLVGHIFSERNDRKNRRVPPINSSTQQMDEQAKWVTLNLLIPCHSFSSHPPCAPLEVSAGRSIGTSVTSVFTLGPCSQAVVRAPNDNIQLSREQGLTHAPTSTWTHAAPLHLTVTLPDVTYEYCCWCCYTWQHCQSHLSGYDWRSLQAASAG